MKALSKELIWLTYTLHWGVTLDCINHLHVVIPESPINGSGWCKSGGCSFGFGYRLIKSTLSFLLQWLASASPHHPSPLALFWGSGEIAVPPAAHAALGSCMFSEAAPWSPALRTTSCSSYDCCGDKNRDMIILNSGQVIQTHGIWYLSWCSVIM